MYFSEPQSTDTPSVIQTGILVWKHAFTYKTSNPEAIILFRNKVHKHIRFCLFGQSKNCVNETSARRLGHQRLSFIAEFRVVSALMQLVVERHLVTLIHQDSFPTQNVIHGEGHPHDVQMQGSPVGGAGGRGSLRPQSMRGVSWRDRR